MANKLLYSVLCLITFVGDAESALRFSQLNDIRTYQVVIPKQHGSTHNGVSTRVNNHEHLDKTIFQFSAFKRDFHLHLFKNKLLISPAYVKTQQHLDGSTYDTKGVENCYYQGHVGNRTKSSVAADTCNGLKGFIRDGDEAFLIEPLIGDNTRTHRGYPVEHIIYRTTDILNEKPFFCGVNRTYNQDRIYYRKSDQDFSDSIPKRLRNRRNAGTIKYIAMVVVVDHAFFLKHKNETENAALSTINYADMIYKTINTRVALQTLHIWNQEDKIKKVDLGNFITYTEDVLFGVEKLNADSAILITGVNMGGLAGLAGMYTMCTTRSSALIIDWSWHTYLVANTVAHEVGHTLGFEHIKSSCKCPKNPCVMSAYTPWSLCQSFTDCAQKTFYRRINSGGLTCLFDYPDHLYGKPKCGNGFVEKGEDCDCGSEDECKKGGADKCCVPKTCKLQQSAACATGTCCKDCQIISRGYLCRKSYDTDCDLPEYCTGKSNRCPTNLYVKSGHSCLSGAGLCYHGLCKSLTTECKTLWGPNAIKGNDFCFSLNTRVNDKYANCGMNGSRYIGCAAKDEFCGKLQCAPLDKDHPLPRWPIIGGELGGRMMKIVRAGSITCKMAHVPYHRDMEDPSMTQSGTKCGEGKVCEDRKCQKITALKWYVPCKKHCLNGGVCNNIGNCYCPLKYYGPSCEFVKPNDTNSYSIGHTSQDKFGHSVTNKIYLGVFLGVIPFCALLIFLIVKKRHVVRAYPEEIHKRWMVYRNKDKMAPKMNLDDNINHKVNHCFEAELRVDNIDNIVSM